MESKIKIEDVNVHPDTGFITISLKMYNKEGNVHHCGPIRHYGCDASMFQSRFGGDIDQLMSHLSSEHQRFTGVHVSLVDELMKRKGQHIEPVQNLDPKKDA